MVQRLVMTLDGGPRAVLYERHAPRDAPPDHILLPVAKATAEAAQSLTYPQNSRTNLYADTAMGDDSINKVVTACAVLTDKHAAELYERLRRFAYKLCRNEDTAHDIVSHVFCTLLTTKIYDWPYAARCVKFQFSNLRQKMRERGFTYLDGDDEPMEMKKAHTPPNQEPAYALAIIQEAFDALPKIQRDVLVLKAQEYSDEEIAAKLQITRWAVDQRGVKGRKQLRAALGPAAKKRQYIGVKKAGRQWEASINVKASAGEGNSGTNFGYRWKYLGLFKTPREAALAYDEAALIHYGKRAKLNFPDKEGA